MGIYDRDYYREQRPPSFAIRAPRTIVVTLILINVAIYVADVFTPARTDPFNHAVVGRWLSDHMAVQVGSLTKPWMWWQLVTYGFAHSPAAFKHILFNMLVLFFLGRDIESTYGWKEFLRLYLVMLVVAGLAWVIVERLQGASALARSYGASGAVTGVVILYALNFPRRTLLLFFVIPVPAWVVGVLVVTLDVLGAVNSDGSNIGYTAHLGGAAFAFLYYRFGWNLGRLTEGRISWPRFKRRPKLRLHRPTREKPDLTAEVDRILEKIHRSGEASLTRKERRVLEDASREYQQRRQG
jgi:membrane associated rhomboid family serine protease